MAARDGPAWQRLMPFAQLRCQSLMLLLKCGFKLAFNAPIAPVAELASNSATHSLAGAVAAAGEAAVRDHRQVVNCDGATVSPKKASQAESAAQRQSLSDARHKVVLQR